MHVFDGARFPFAENRSYTPGPATMGDLRAFLGWLGIDRTVLVQPSVYGTDNRALLDASAHRDHRIAETIQEAKASIPAIAGRDVQYLWRIFRDFNRRRGKTEVPLRLLLGFPRKWRGTGAAKPVLAARTAPSAPAGMTEPRLPLQDAAPHPQEADELATLAPWANAATTRAT